MPIAKLPGLAMHYDVHGRGDPVMFVMGLAVPGSGWRLQVEGLCDRHTCITFDNRGIGRTETTPGVYSTRMMAKDTFALMDHLRIERAHVVGISMGGMIAQKMALIAKHRVRSLTLIATHGGGPTASPPSGTVRRFLRLQVSRDPEQRFRLFNEILFTAEFCAEHGARLRDGMAADLLHARQSRMGFTGQMGAVLTHRTGPILATLAGTPVMLMTGTHDACVRPVNTHMLATWMPWAQVRTYAGAGHGVNVQRYESVNRDLRAFLAG